MHPVLVPKPFRGVVTVRWLTDINGVCQAREYYDRHADCKASLLALAKQVSINGRVGKVPENGHPLQGEYDSLQVLKPGDHRFMGFRHGGDFYLTNAAAKKPKPKQQEPDYKIAKGLRDKFFEELAKGTK